MRIYELLNPDASLDQNNSGMGMGTNSSGNMSADMTGGVNSMGATSGQPAQPSMQMADAGTNGPDSTFNKMMGNNQKADNIANSPFGSNSQLGLGGNFFQSTVGKPPIPLE